MRRRSAAGCWSSALTAISEDNYLAYTYNRFQACRFGLEGEVVDPVAGVRRTIAEDVAATLQAVCGARARARLRGAAAASRARRARGQRCALDARSVRRRAGRCADLVWQQAERFRRG